MPRRKCTKYVPFNLQNSPLQCQNSVQTKVLPGRKGLNNASGCRQALPVKAYADHDTLDQALKCAWRLPPSLPPSLFLPSDSRPSYGRSRGRKGLAGGKIDNKGFKASELPTAKPLSRQWGSRQTLPSQALQPHQPWQKAGRTIILTIWLSRWPHTEMGLSLQLWLVLWLACHWR